ncbi:hypothetical protein [Streptomyces sp. NRRL B-1347]|uniref:hypothetical protein n=1 Tax=Streptomyces sp. NRRL B-1347 TaxID=1476877 RepID=UPI0004C5B26A|nr:hypothetical protein [Streptomyces sp. NRRL B-1347]
MSEHQIAPAEEQPETPAVEPQTAEEPSDAPEVQPEAEEPTEAHMEPGPSMEEFKALQEAYSALASQLDDLRQSPPKVPTHIGEGAPVSAASGAQEEAPPKQSQSDLFRAALERD